MNKKLTVLFLGVLFLVPVASHAAPLDEQKTLIMQHMIQLLEAQIAELQDRLTTLEYTKTLGAVEVPTTTPATNSWTCTYVKDPSGHPHRSCGG